MKNVKNIYIVLIFVLAASLFYFKPDLTNLRYKNQEKILQIENSEGGSISSSTSKQVYAPPPLKSDENSDIGLLTKSGTILETNVQREQIDLPKLKENEILDESAMLKARDILDKQYFDHISPSGTGPSDLADEVEYDYIVIGENLALGGFKSDAALVDAWMSSPGHRENILNSDFQEIGVATIQGKYEDRTVWVAVQEFGTAGTACPSVDAILKKTLIGDQKKISEMKKEINIQKENLSSIEKNDRSAYENAVNSYNDLVEQYNNLVGETKSTANKLNDQIEKYNSCLKKYSKT